VSEQQIAKPQRLAAAWPIDDQYGDTAAGNVRHTPEKLKLLLGIEPREAHDAGCALRSRVLRMHEDRRKSATVKGQIDEFDTWAVRECRKSFEAIQRAREGLDRRFVLRLAKMLRVLVQRARPQVVGCGSELLPFRLGILRATVEDLALLSHDAKPGFVVAHVSPKLAPCAVDFRDVRPAIWRGTQ
jgi:hypothetical protein